MAPAWTANRAAFRALYFGCCQLAGAQSRWEEKVKTVGHLCCNLSLHETKLSSSKNERLTLSPEACLCACLAVSGFSVPVMSLPHTPILTMSILFWFVWVLLLYVQATV